jgi:hypothetical protein
MTMKSHLFVEQMSCIAPAKIEQIVPDKQSLTLM